MGFFRSAIGLFRGGARKHRDERAAELPKEQAGTVTAQPAVAGREVKREARPDPNKPGWGLSVGQVGKAREDDSSR